MSDPTRQLPPFERVIEEHGQAVLRFCAAQAGPQRAEDVFQETMLAALRAYDEVRDAAAIRSWLFAIAARKAVDAHRRRAREPEPVADLDPPADGGDIAVRDDALWRARAQRCPTSSARRSRSATWPISRTGRSPRSWGRARPRRRRNVFEGLEQLRRQASPTDLTKA